MHADWLKAIYHNSMETENFLGAYYMKEIENFLSLFPY